MKGSVLILKVKTNTFRVIDQFNWSRGRDLFWLSNPLKPKWNVWLSINTCHPTVRTASLWFCNLSCCSICLWIRLEHMYVDGEPILSSRLSLIFPSKQIFIDPHLFLKLCSSHHSSNANEAQMINLMKLRHSDAFFVLTKEYGVAFKERIYNTSNE